MRDIVKYYKDSEGRIWRKFKDEQWIENDELGRGVWNYGHGLIEVEKPVQTPPSFN